MKKEDFNVGDKVKNRHRESYYQSGIVVSIEDGCNGLIEVKWQDGFYGGVETGYFPAQDLTKL